MYQLHHSGDLSGLLLLHSSAGDKEGMKSLALKAQEVGRSNVAFLAFFVTGNHKPIQPLSLTPAISSIVYFTPLSLRHHALTLPCSDIPPHILLLPPPPHRSSGGMYSIVD